MTNNKAATEMTVLERQGDGTAAPVNRQDFENPDSLLLAAKLWRQLGYEVHVHWTRRPDDEGVLSQLNALGVVTRH